MSFESKDNMVKMKKELTVFFSKIFIYENMNLLPSWYQIHI